MGKRSLLVLGSVTFRRGNDSELKGNYAKAKLKQQTRLWVNIEGNILIGVH